MYSIEKCRTRMRIWSWRLWWTTPLLLLAFSFTTLPAPAQAHRFVRTDTNLPPEWCPSQPSESYVSAHLKPGNLIYVFCKYAVLKYDYSVGNSVHLLNTPISSFSDYQSAAGISTNDQIYLFSAEPLAGTLSIHRLLPMEANWTHAADVPDFEFVYGAAAVWNANSAVGHVYLFGASLASATIWKFGVNSHDMTKSGSLAAARTAAGVVWVKEEGCAFIFGGYISGPGVNSNSVSAEVLKYDPDNETTTWYANLSVGVVDPGIVSTGTAVYLLCGVHGEDAEASRQHNLLRFDIATRQTTVEFVEGLEHVDCHAPAAVYVNDKRGDGDTLNRVYMFGGSVYSEQIIAYIDLDEEGNPEMSPPSSASTTEAPPGGGLQLVISENVKLSDTCGGSSTSAAAVYDGDDTAYIFCTDVMYAYSLSADKITFIADLVPQPPSTARRAAAAAVVMIQGGKILYFGNDESAQGKVWELSVDDLTNWKEVADIPHTHAWNTGDAHWDGADVVYVIHAGDVADDSNDIKKLFLPGYTWSESVLLPENFDQFSSVWAPGDGGHGQDGNGAFLFGGRSDVGTAKQILRYHTVNETISLQGFLPAHVRRPGAVWTGRHVYLTCAGYLADDPSSNFVRFDPVLRRAVVEPVEGWDFSCRNEAAIYSPTLKRVYIFGGEFEDELEASVKYIDVSVFEGSTATPYTTSTTPFSTPTTVAPFTTEKVTPSSEPPSTASTEESTTIEATSTTRAPNSSTEAPITTTTTAAEPGCNALDKYGILYRALIGQTARNPCPGISNGTATWFCVSDGAFEGDNPDYSGCKSLWMEEIKEKIDKVEPGGSMNVSYASSLLRDIQAHVREATNLSNGNGNGNGNGSNMTTYFGHEIKTVLEFGEEILILVQPNWLSEAEGLTTTTFSIFQQALTHTSPWEELSERSRAETGTTFLRASDQASLQLGHRFQPWARTTNLRPKDQARAGYRHPFDSFASEFRALSGAEPIEPESGGNTGHRLTFPDQFRPKSNSYIEIPRNWAQYFVDEDYDYVAFSGFELSRAKASYLFPPPAAAIASTSASSTDSQSRSSQLPAAGSTAQRILNGPLMGFTLVGGSAARATCRSGDDAGLNFTFTGEGVRITLQHDVPAFGPDRAEVRRRLHPGESPKAVLGSGVCVYWDEVALNWSPDGCALVSSTPDRTVCECSHLTAFAVVMDLHEYVGKSPALEILTWILCSASIVCLLATIAMFVFSRCGYWKQLINKHPRNDMTLNLSIALLVANVLILATMDKHNLHLSDGACVAAAIGLHYALLCAFAWMALEGVLLAKLVFIDVFASGREHATLERVGALTVPAVIVGVTCGVSFGRGEYAYGNDAFCSLHGRYLWSFIGVVAVVLIFNSVVLVMSIRKSYLLAENPNRAVAVVRKAKSVSFWIRGAISLTVIMGLTWISGFLMLIEDPTTANVAAYIFTVTSASQGIFIFVFHIASSKKVRSHFRSITFSAKSTAATTTGAYTTKEVSGVRSSSSS